MRNLKKLLTFFNGTTTSAGAQQHQVQAFFGKKIEKSTCAVEVRIIITFVNQIFL